MGGLLESFVDAFLNQKKASSKKFKNLLPEQFVKSELGEKKWESDNYCQLLKITSYVAQMTDGYAIDLYRKISGIDLPQIG
jgi:dGTPase